MSYIEEALQKAKALAKQARGDGGGEVAVRPSGGGLAAVGEARSSEASPHMAPHMRAQAEGRRLFVGGLSYETTDSSLEAFLSAQGYPTEECRVKRDMEGSSRGFAFITFPVVGVLDKCFESQPHVIDGKKVELRKVSPDGSGNWGGTSNAGDGAAGTKRPSMGMTRYGGGGANVTRVYVGSGPADSSRFRGLNDNVQDEDLRAYFERYGTVTGIAQHRWEDTGRKKGFGYIEFAEFEAAQAAIGLHTLCGVELEVKPYSQGGLRNPNPPPDHRGKDTYGRGSEGSESSYGYGSDNKRARTGGEYGGQQASGGGQGGDNPNAMMSQMKGMMEQMQQMQNSMGGGAAHPGMAAMQQQMYSMYGTMYGGSGGGMYGSQGQSGYGGSSGGYGSGASSYGDSGPKPPLPSGPAPPSTPYPNEEGVCYDFQQGRCMRGDRCKYKHVELPKEGICRDFQNGDCKRDRCRFSHDMSGQDGGGGGGGYSRGYQGRNDL